MFNPDYPARLRELVGHCRRAAEHSYELEAKAALRTIGEHLRAWPRKSSGAATQKATGLRTKGISARVQETIGTKRNSPRSPWRQRARSPPEGDRAWRSLPRRPASRHPLKERCQARSGCPGCGDGLRPASPYRRSSSWDSPICRGSQQRIRARRKRGSPHSSLPLAQTTEGNRSAAMPHTRSRWAICATRAAASSSHAFAMPRSLARSPGDLARFAIARHSRAFLRKSSAFCIQSERR